MPTNPLAAAANGTCSCDNPDGSSSYFTFLNNNYKTLQLDIVGFLAILGEGSVLSTSQVATLSWMIFLPRLVPAPQALLKPAREDKLSPHQGFVTSVWSGNIRHYINHVGHVLVDAENCPAYSVRCVEVRRKHNEGEVTAKNFGPLWYVAIMGSVFSIVLLIMSIVRHDLMAMLATILLSLLSTLIGWGNKWRLNLPSRKKPNIWTPQGDVAIRYPKGNFLIVQCVEDVARELYFAPEDINYLVNEAWQYRLISLVGTMMLMFGVIFLSNASVELQIGFAGSYILLNAFYWIVAALPNKFLWDMSCFEVHEQCFALESDPEVLPEKTRTKWVDYNDTFTWALWKAIVATKEIGWIRRSNAAPDTPAWNDWLKEAKEMATFIQGPGAEPFKTVKVNGKSVKAWTVPEWDPQEALTLCMDRYRDTENAEKV